MRTALENVKLGSLAVSSRIFALCAGIVALTGCIIVDGGSTTTIDNGNTTPPPPPAEPMLMTIDTDMALDAKGGDGVGIFVEYSSGGRYRIWTTCDTISSNQTCPFDIYVSVDTQSVVSSITEENLEGTDSVFSQQGQGAVDLHFDTNSDYDAVVLDVTPGAILRVEAYVDGIGQPRFIYWVGDGFLHQGAPTNPVDLQPSKP